MFLWTIAAQGEGDIGNAWLGYQFIWIPLHIFADVCLVLLYTSICDMVFSGDDVAGWRHCINITFWTLASASSLLIAVARGGSLAGADPSWTNVAKDIGKYCRFVTFLSSFVFMVIAHRKIHVVSPHLTLHHSHGVYVRQLFIHTPCTMHHVHRSCASTRHNQRSRRLSSKWTRSVAPFGATTTRNG